MDAAPAAAQPPVTKTKTKTTILHQFHVLVLWHVWHWWWWDWCKLLANILFLHHLMVAAMVIEFSEQLSNSITQFHSFVFVKDRYRAIDRIFSAATTTTAHTSSSSSHWWTRRAVSRRTNNVSTQQLTMRARATVTTRERVREREREREREQKW